MSEQDRARVAAVKRRIRAAEGPHHVGGVYYANADDADRQRRLAAERAVREETRRDEWSRRNGTAPPLRIATWLLPHERARVDAACGGLALSHCETVPAMRAALAGGPADAALVSVTLVRPTTATALTMLVRAFPACAVVELVTDVDEAHALGGTMLLGRAGGARSSTCGRRRAGPRFAARSSRRGTRTPSSGGHSTPS